MTLPNRPWVIRPAPSTEELKELTDIYHPLISVLLWHRGVTTPAAAKEFFEPSFPDHLADPFTFYQMREALEVLIRCIRERSLIMIHGDYDADGVTSTVAMVETIQALGGVVEWYVPDRFTEGYGLRTETIKKFIAKNVQLLITVDCGSTNVDEIAVAREAGMEVIVIDHHHQPAKLPNASAIINPVFDDEQYPFRYHASAGVVFTVVRALLQETKNGETLGHPLVAGWEKWLLDIVAIATVADMMPIKGENRLFVHYGLKVLARTRRPGLRALISASGVSLHDVDEVTLGFHIGPRLNAAGRLQHASTAVKLLLTTDPIEAESLARELQQLNDDRKSLTELATNEAWDQIQTLGEAQGYAVFAPHWSAGVLGLIAGRVADRSGRPVFVMTQIDKKIVGSGRAGGNLDIMEIMNAGKANFAQFGGHTGACGFTLKEGVTPQQFHEWLVGYMNEHHPVVQPKELHLDIELPLSQLTPELLSAIDRLAPFGLSATRPIIYLRGVDVRDAQRVGGTKQHLRLRVHENGVARSAIGFRLGERHPEVAEAATIDLAVEPSWNEWQGKRDIQLRIIDIRPTTYGTISA